MNTELVNISHALKVATQHGASSFYTPFKEALFADKAVKKALVTEAQGPRRTVYKLPRDMAEEFGRRYAQTRPKQRSVAQPAPAQLELTLTVPEATEEQGQEPLKSAVAMLTQRVERLESMLHSMDAKLVRLLMLWEGDDK